MAAGQDQVRGTGQTYGSDRARAERLDAAPGEHVWIAIVAYRTTAENIEAGRSGEPVMFDAENIAALSFGCYRCEREYSRRAAKSPCPGEPC